MTDLQYPLIGLLGRARSGKDTFARGLIARGYQRVAFADALRTSLLKTNPLVASSWNDGIPRRLSVLVHSFGWEGLKSGEYGAEVRRLLQHHGVAIREIDPDFWVTAAIGRVGTPDGVVVTDVRFPNEAETIQERGGILVRVVRPSLVTPKTAHISETALDDYPTDFTVRNSGTSAEFVELARTLRF